MDRLKTSFDITKERFLSLVQNSRSFVKVKNWENEIDYIDRAQIMHY